MAFTIAFVSTLALIQATTCQFLGNSLNPGLNFNGPYGFPNNQANLAGPSAGCGANGGSFTVTSSSRIAPTGVSILAENLSIEGPLSVGGQLPFLGSVGLEGALAAIGTSTVSYGCGSGNVGITNEGLGTPGSYMPGAYGSNLAGSQFGPGLSNTFGAGANLPASGLNGYGPGLSNPAFGNGLSFGYGYNGIGAGTALK